MSYPGYFRDLIRGFLLEDKVGKKRLAEFERAAQEWKTETCEKNLIRRYLREIAVVLAGRHTGPDGCDAAWKTETCETCEFRVGHVCRLNPPTIEANFRGDPDVYPAVISNHPDPNPIKPACAQWRRAATAPDKGAKQ